MVEGTCVSANSYIENIPQLDLVLVVIHLFRLLAIYNIHSISFQYFCLAFKLIWSINVIIAIHFDYSPHIERWSMPILSIIELAAIIEFHIDWICVVPKEFTGSDQPMILSNSLCCVRTSNNNNRILWDQ